MRPELPYYPALLEEDLERVVSSSANRRSISICSFLPDYPDVEFCRRPATRIRELPRPVDFVLATFWLVLADQATYTIERRDLAYRQAPVAPPKLVGLLSTSHNNLHPAYLFVALSFGELGDVALVPALLTELGRRILPDVRSTVSNWPAIASHMLAAVHPQAGPDSINAYVPCGDRYRRRPNWQAVQTWKASAHDLMLEAIAPAR